MDVHSPEQRSFNMSRIKGKDTRPEMMVRKWLWANGYRYRLHREDLPGKPDIVLPRHRTVILVHGCYWHRHGCWMTTTPSTRQDFWLAKFEENVERDQSNLEALLSDGWRVMVVWECTLRGRTADPEQVSNQLLNFIESENRFCESRTAR